MKIAMGMLLVFLLMACSPNSPTEETFKETPKETSEQIANRKWLKETIIPEVVFQDTPLKDALWFLQERSVELGQSTIPHRSIREPYEPSIKPDKPAVSGRGGFDDASAGGGFSGESESGVGNAHITFRAINISVWDALQRTVKQVGLSFEIEPSGHVRIVAEGE